MACAPADRAPRAAGGLVHRRSRLGQRPRLAHGLPGGLRAGGRGGGLHRREDGLGPLDDAPRWRAARRARGAGGGRLDDGAGALARGRVPLHRERNRGGLAGPRLARPAVHHAGGPLHPRPGWRGLGHRAVPRVRGLQASAAPRGRPDRGPRAALQHGAHRSRPAGHAGGVRRRLAVPADRDARLRRAGHLDAPSHRRPGRHRLAVPAGRDGVHPGGDGRVHGAHAAGGLIAVGRRVGRRGRAAGPRCAGVPEVLPGGRRLPRRRGRHVRAHGADREPLVQRRRHGVHGHGAHRRDGPALARGHLRHVRPAGLDPDRGHELPDDRGRSPGWRHGGGAGVRVHARCHHADHPRRLPGQPGGLARHTDLHGPGGQRAADGRGRVAGGRGAARDGEPVRAEERDAALRRRGGPHGQRAARGNRGLPGGDQRAVHGRAGGGARADGVRAARGDHGGGGPAVRRAGHGRPGPGGPVRPRRVHAGVPLVRRALLLRHGPDWLPV